MDGTSSEKFIGQWNQSTIGDKMKVEFEQN